MTQRPDTAAENLRQRLVPSDIHPPFGHYVHGLKLVNPQEILVTSGQLGISKDDAIPSDITAQTEICFKNIEAILASGGMDFSHVLRINAYVTDRDYFPAYMAVRDRYLSQPVASTLLVVSGFSRAEFKVEVEITAGR